MPNLLQSFCIMLSKILSSEFRCHLHDIKFKDKKYVCLFFLGLLSTNVVLYPKFLFLIHYVDT